LQKTGPREAAVKLLVANHQLDRLAGSELHTLDLCRGFKHAGHDVSVFTLEPGIVSDLLKEEGFRLFSPHNALAMERQRFDLVYLHHSTCEVFLGITFAGCIPIVRGFVSRKGPAAVPTNGSFLSGALYISEEVQEAMSSYNANIPSLVARNVYDERHVPSGVAIGERRPNKPNFALVSNHLDLDLVRLLQDAAGKGSCSFTHFGHPNKRVPITAQSLMSFNAVISIGRTVPFAAALGKPVYVCDIHGSDGWLTRQNYKESQSCNFSGRRFAIRDWSLVNQELLDPRYWPGASDLVWIRARVAQDHGLSRRIGQLEGFFTDVVRRAPVPVQVPHGYRGVLNFIRSRAKTMQHYEQRIESLEKSLASERRRAQMLGVQVEELTSQARDLTGHMQNSGAQATGNGGFFNSLNHLRDKLLGS
jgi:hypothetical protein